MKKSNPKEKTSPAQARPKKEIPQPHLHPGRRLSPALRRQQLWRNSFIVISKEFWVDFFWVRLVALAGDHRLIG